MPLPSRCDDATHATQESASKDNIPLDITVGRGNSNRAWPLCHASPHKWHECKELLCTLPLGHSSPHTFEHRCNNFRCTLREGHAGAHVYCSYWRDCSEPDCVLFFGHTPPHKFWRPCSIAGCSRGSNHDGLHMEDPYYGLSRSVAQRAEQAIKNAALAAHSVDEMVFRTMNDESIICKVKGLTRKPLPSNFMTPSEIIPKKSFYFIGEEGPTCRFAFDILRRENIYQSHRRISSYKARMPKNRAEPTQAKQRLPFPSTFIATPSPSRSPIYLGDTIIKLESLERRQPLPVPIATLATMERMLTAIPAEALPTKLPVNATRTEFCTLSYSKLDTSQNQIRLFELYPSINASEIKGSFHYVELSASLEYVALSYTWGDETSCREIQVGNGTQIPVRENLWWFLRLQSSSLSKSQFYWIDAICINQSDIKERNHQVGLMTQIYANATAVYVWLGCESSNSNLAMEYVAKKASKKLKVKGLGFRPIWSEKEGKALVELCERPYWRRMWIIQEIINARNIVVWCGTRSFDWGSVVKLYQKLKVLESTNWLAHHAFALRVFQSSASVIIWQRAYWRHPDTPTPSPNTLISVFYSWQCTDLRDKVYALVGMASTETAIIPDYSKSMYDICKDVWEKDAKNDAQFYGLLNRVLGLWREPMELGQHSPRYLILRKRFISFKQEGITTTEVDHDNT